LSITTWYILGGLTFWVRRSSTTELPLSPSRTGVVGAVGREGFFVAMKTIL
jgi:hypothetical protein